MPLTFYANYNSLERAHQVARESQQALRAGFYRIYQRLDRRFEFNSVPRRAIPPEWRLISVCEFDSKLNQWITIIEEEPAA